MRVASLITLVAHEVQQQLYAAGCPAPASALHQAGLRDGLEIVIDYWSQGEAGVAFDHLFYMITEPDLQVAAKAHAELARASDMPELPRYPLTLTRRTSGV